MAEVNLAADPREVSTKGAVNEMRRNGNVPGVLYSKDMDTVSFSVSELALKPIIYTTEMRLVNLKIGDAEEVKSILKDIQFDPLTDRVVHVDFQAITVGQVIQVQVPINIVGQAVGVKEGGRFIQNLHKVDVECLPRDIPNHLDVDVSDLHIGESILLRDLEFENITFLNPEDTTVAAVTTARSLEEEETEELLEDEESVEPEVIGKGKSEEDEQETEG
jgi:large subunit ribosomal protein L25